MATRIRWFQTYDEHGADSENTLQYWDEDAELWLDVNHFRVREGSDAHDSYRSDPDMY